MIIESLMVVYDYSFAEYHVYHINVQLSVERA
jgi:hypothetical protein